MGRGGSCWRGVEDGFFAGRDPDGRNDGAGDDDLSGLKRFAEGRKQVGGVTNYVDEVAGQALEGLGIADAGEFGSVAKDARGKAIENAAGAGRIVATKDDGALIGFASQRACSGVGGRIS